MFVIMTERSSLCIVSLYIDHKIDSLVFLLLHLSSDYKNAQIDLNFQNLRKLKVQVKMLKSS